MKKISFANHEKSKYWSNKNKTIPEKVSLNSHKQFIFNCDCGHEIEKRISDISRLSKGSWCGYCSNPPKKLCETEDCKQCLEKSFASHEKAKFWSNKNELIPRNIFKSASNKYIFNCICGHDFEASPNNINAKNNKWCPYCCIPCHK